MPFKSISRAVAILVVMLSCLALAEVRSKGEVVNVASLSTQEIEEQLQVRVLRRVWAEVTSQY